MKVLTLNQGASEIVYNWKCNCKQCSQRYRNNFSKCKYRLFKLKYTICKWFFNIDCNPKRLNNWKHNQRNIRIYFRNRNNKKYTNVKEYKMKLKKEINNAISLSKRLNKSLYRILGFFNEVSKKPNEIDILGDVYKE